MKTVDEIMAEAFSGSRDPRSIEYMAGVRAALEFRINGKNIIHPFPPGTAASDAFSAGTEEGHRTWRAETKKDEDE